MAKAKNMENAEITISASYDCGYAWTGGDVGNVEFCNEFNSVELISENG